MIVVADTGPITHRPITALATRPIAHADMWTVSESEVADLLRLDLMARLHDAKEKETLYRQAHQQSFEAFEETVQQGEEEFGQWEDYLEWKAYRRVRGNLEQKIEALRRGDVESLEPRK